MDGVVVLEAPISNGYSARVIEAAKLLGGFDAIASDSSPVGTGGPSA